MILRIAGCEITLFYFWTSAIFFRNFVSALRISGCGMRNHTFLFWTSAIFFCNFVSTFSWTIDFLVDLPLTIRSSSFAELWIFCLSFAGCFLIVESCAGCFLTVHSRTNVDLHSVFANYTKTDPHSSDLMLITMPLHHRVMSSLPSSMLPHHLAIFSLL